MAEAGDLVLTVAGLTTLMKISHRTRVRTTCSTWSVAGNFSDNPGLP